MASIRESAPSSNADKDPSAPLEGPVSLLWAYQLRREHALLLNRLDSLADAVRNEDAAAQVESFGHNLEAAGGRVTAVEKEVNRHRLDLQAIRAKVSSGDEAIAQIHLDIAKNEEQHRSKIESLKAEQTSMSNQIELFKAAVSMTSESTVKEQQYQIRLLQDKTVELEGRFKELSEREVTVVKDSFEDNSPPNFRKPQLINNSNVSKKIDYSRHKAFSHANDLLQEIEEEADSNVRALHPFQREETPSTEFDLDAGVATMSYAQYLGDRTTQEGSMAMLPDPLPPRSHQTQRVDEHISLRQGPTQSWEKYLKEGRDLVAVSRKRKEGAIVDNFVAGVLDPILRADCERWLDNRVWIWENVETFGPRHKSPEASPELSSTANPTPRPQRTSEIKRPRRNANSQVVSKELARLLEDQGRHRVESGVVAQSSEPNGNRRSQRIAKQNTAASQQTGDTKQVAAAKRKNRRPAMDEEEPPQQSRNQRKEAVKGPRQPSTKSAEKSLVQSQPVRTRATGLKQATVPGETEANDENEEPVQARGPEELAKAVTHVVPSQVEKPNMELDHNLGLNLREKARKMHEIFPNETLKLCHDALVVKKGNCQNACDWVVHRTAQLKKAPSVKHNVLPMTPTPANRHRSVSHPANPNAVDQRPDPYKTPQQRVYFARTSNKRKLEPSEQEQVANMKRAKMVKKKRRGPPPPIPILPSSETE